MSYLSQNRIYQHGYYNCKVYIEQMDHHWGYYDDIQGHKIHSIDQHILWGMYKIQSMLRAHQINLYVQFPVGYYQ